MNSIFYPHGVYKAAPPHTHRSEASSMSRTQNLIGPSGPSIDRAVPALAGTVVLASLALGSLHDRRWRTLTAFVGGNLLLYSAVGWCPASLAMRRLGMRRSGPATTR